MNIHERKLTAGALVLNGSHGSLFPPVNGLWQILAHRILVSRARRPGQAFLGIQLGTQICSLELLMAQICKLVQPQFVGWIPLVVVLVNIQKIVFKYRELLLLLVKTIVGFLMLSQPQLIELHDRVISYQILAIVADDGEICS